MCTSVLCFSFCFNIADRAAALFELPCGQLRNRTREAGAWKENTPLSEMSAHLLALLAAINGKSKCPTPIKDLIKSWLKSVRIFHGLWAGHRFLGGSCFVGFWLSILHLQQGLCVIAFHENKSVVMSNCSSERRVALTLVRLGLKLAKVIKFEEYSECSLATFRAHMGDLLSFGSLVWNTDRN